MNTSDINGTIGNRLRDLTTGARRPTRTQREPAGAEVPKQRAWLDPRRLCIVYACRERRRIIRK